MDLALATLIMLAATSKAYTLELQNNNVESAGRLADVTWAEKINAAIAARAPEEPLMRRSYVSAGHFQTADTNVVLGSYTRKVRLTLGTCTYPRCA
jgi:hypothetical protein